MSLIPRGDRVIVKRLTAPEPKPGDVRLPDSQLAPPNEGIVKYVGPGSRNRVTGRIDPIDLQPGDHVCFVEHAGAEEEIDGETCLIMRDEEIYAVRR